MGESAFISLAICTSDTQVTHSNPYMYLSLYLAHPRNTTLSEFEAVMVLPEMTQNYGNYRYGNYIGNAHRR